MSDRPPNPIDVVGAIQSAYEKGDDEAALALIDPGVEWVEPQGFPGATTYRGHDGVRESMAKFWGTWADPVSEYLDMHEVADRVFVCLRIRAKGRTSGAPGEFDLFQVWTVRDGQVVRMHAYLDRDEAYRAAGLETPRKEAAQ